MNILRENIVIRLIILLGICFAAAYARTRVAQAILIFSAIVFAITTVLIKMRKKE